MDESGFASACNAYVYDEDVWDFLVKYDNNLAGVTQYLEPDCVTLINNQFLVAYKNHYNAQGVPLTQEDLFRIGYAQIPKCFGLMDISGPQSIGVLQVQNFPGLSLKGREVLVGFIDTGIDYQNRLFRNADGTTRILGIWDQTEEAYMQTEPGTEPVFGYGREYRKEKIDEALRSMQPLTIVPSMDLDGHGTFLASVASGGYYEDDGEAFTGVAPESDILVVKLKTAKNRLREYFKIPDDVPCYSEVDLILGIKYLLNKAIELRKPLVICLGVGTSQGDHNGNLNLELYLDTIVTLPGICVVSSAGNELGSSGHFSSGIYTGGSRQSMVADSQNRILQSSMELYLNSFNPGFCLEIWGKAPSLYRVVVVSPTGERFGSLIPNRDSAGEIIFLYEGTRVYGESIVVEYNSGDPFVFLRFEDVTAGIWRIEVTESYNSFPAGYDAWLPIRQFRQSEVRFSMPDPEVILCAPGNARGTITVAGYKHLDNALYINSSRGYTRKGRIQPDITAPAVDVYGAFAGGSRPLFTRRSGTSIASAFTAGAAALLMEWGITKGNNYALNTEVIRQIFIRGASQPVDIPYPNVSWGWGALNLYQSFEILRNRDGRI